MDRGREERIPRNERTCQICYNGIEYELHFLLHCKGYLQKRKEMPTVKYKCKTSGKMKVKKFPYNAVGKAQARTFSDLMNGSKTNNPNTKMTEMGY